MRLRDIAGSYQVVQVYLSHLRTNRLILGDPPRSCQFQRFLWMNTTDLESMRRPGVKSLRNWKSLRLEARPWSTGSVHSACGVPVVLASRLLPKWFSQPSPRGSGVAVHRSLPSIPSIEKSCVTWCGHVWTVDCSREQTLQKCSLLITCIDRAQDAETC